MICIAFIALFSYTIVLALYEIRTADVRLYNDATYIPGYHLHTIGTFPIYSFYDCIYLCQNNDYCRTATYFESNTGTMCSLFEENSFVGKIISSTLTFSIVISFNLCPNGFAEPAHICFGLPENIQSPVTVQYAMDNLRLMQQWSKLVYYPIIFPTQLYVPSFTSGTVQIFEWPSLRSVRNLTFPLSIYSFDMNLSGTYLLTSRTTYSLRYFSPFQNWTDSSTTFYPAFLSHDYIISLSNGNSTVYIRNATTYQKMFNLTISNTSNWWGRVLNQQLYVTSTSGLRQIDLSQGESALPVVLVPNISLKEMFLDASGRLYVEQYDTTKNNSFIYNIHGTQLANYTKGSKLIAKASKYTYYILVNQENPLLFYQYP